MKKQSVLEIARQLGLELIGNHSLEVEGLAELDRPVTGRILYAGPQIRDLFFLDQGDAFLLAVELKDRVLVDSAKAYLFTDKPQEHFVTLLAIFAKDVDADRGVIDPAASVDADVMLGAGVCVGQHAVIRSGSVIGDDTIIMPNVFIGSGVRIGRCCQIHPGVVIGRDCVLGDHVVIASNTVVGTDGFGFYKSEGKPIKIPHIGNVVIGDHVEIGALCTISRGTIGSTEIGDHVKTADLVHVAHNVRIGRGTVIAGQSGIAGSSRIGSGVTLAGQVGIADHVTIGDQVSIGAQSGVASHGHVPAGSPYFGSPAGPVEKEKRKIAILRKLPELYADIRKLKKEHPQED
ncbi:MAG: UDP-3-O-(3-hydroxymyristoyl)glucosamine N-acyltransferase [Planctomycetes bacterium]|nr:UDP-3-O-(3-hydroxymyristoyl)glucosamine N-acyltransferase [Planctomycetota bacterium]